VVTTPCPVGGRTSTTLVPPHLPTYPIEVPPLPTELCMHSLYMGVCAWLSFLGYVQ
jgi:hypothetical protein